MTEFWNPTGPLEAESAGEQPHLLPDSRVLRPGGDDPVHDLAIGTPCGARLMATGPFTSEDLGVACYHSKTGAAELPP